MRRENAFKNIKISFIFYFITIIFSFISRSYFIKLLGANISGFNNLIASLLGFLNIAELGIATAITYALYTPLRNKEYDKLNEIMILFKFYYIRIGKFVFLSGIIISLFLKLFVKNQVPIIDAYVYYYLFLINSSLSYFFNYKEVLLSADQKQYIVTVINNSIKIVKTIVQIILLIYTKNYALWIIVELIFNLIGWILISIKVKNLYPYISFKSNKDIKEIRKNNNSIIKAIKEVFFHKIATFIVNQTDSILISLFLSLKQTAIYGNYTMIISNISNLIGTVMNSFKGSVGDLIAEGNEKNTYKIFKQLYIIDNILAIIISYTLYNVVNSFMIIWVGKEYLFDKTIVLIMLINLYIQISRSSIEKFKESFGIFWDVWAPALEGIINLSVSLILANYIGIIGLFIGTFISNITIVLIWKPYVLYKYGLKTPIKNYIKIFINVLFNNMVIIMLSNYLIDMINKFTILNLNPIINFGVNSIVSFSIVSTITFIMYMFNKSFRGLVKDVMYRVRCKLNLVI